VNWSVLATWTTSLKNDDRKKTTAATPAVTIIRVKITHPKSPVQSGRTNSIADASTGARVRRSIGRLPSPRDAQSTGTSDRSSTAAMTSRLSRTWWMVENKKVRTKPSNAPPCCIPARKPLAFPNSASGTMSGMIA